MCFIAQNEIDRLNKIGLLATLLEDKTTLSNIIWATNTYKHLGAEYERNQPIKVEQLVSGMFKLKSRSEKARCEQVVRTKSHAEVFTPIWVVQEMNDFIDSQWLGQKFTFTGKPFPFSKEKTWFDFVDSRRLEITCGEAPYLVTRYDASTGKGIPILQRTGILDRKLQVVSENTSDPEEWFAWTLRAYQATYGYELQGDNLLLARINLLLTFEDYLQEKFTRLPTKNEYLQIVNIIIRNIWQMDGLTGLIPFCKVQESDAQMDLFIESVCQNQHEKNVVCRIYDWRTKQWEDFNRLKKG